MRCLSASHAGRTDVAAFFAAFFAAATWRIFLVGGATLCGACQKGHGSMPSVCTPSCAAPSWPYFHAPVKNYWDFDVWEKRRGLFFWRRSVEYDWACYLALLGEGVAWYRKGVRAMRRAGKRLNHVLTRNWTTVRRCELLSSVLYQEEMPRSILSISEFKNTSDVGKTQAPPNCVTVAHATSNHATFRVCVQECQHISGFQTTGPQKTFFIWMRNQGLNSLIKSTSKFLTLSVSETKSFSNPKCSQKLPLTNPETFMHLRQHARTEPTTDEDQIRLSGLQGQSLLLVCLLAWPFRFEIWKNLGKSQKKRKIT